MPDPATDMVIRQWEMGFPEETARLRKAGTLVEYAEQAADNWARVVSDCLAKGMNYYQAQEVALPEWGQPPTLSGSTPRDREA